MSDSHIPCLADVLRARQTIAPYLRPTPLYRYQGLCDLLGAEAYVKHENQRNALRFLVENGYVNELNAGLELTEKGAKALKKL